jgi:hypothetical protein
MMLLQTVVDTGPTVGVLVAALLGAIPIIGIMGWTAVKILGPIGQAFARRIGGGAGDEEFLERRLESLAQELDQVRHQLAETQDRVDFTERLLAQHRQADQLPRG